MQPEIFVISKLFPFVLDKTLKIESKYKWLLIPGVKSFFNDRFYFTNSELLT